MARIIDSFPWGATAVPIHIDPRAPARTAFPSRFELVVHATLWLALATAIGAANAQIPGGIGNLGGLPNMSGMGSGNAAGVLSYCMKNKLLGSGDPSSVIGSLTKKPGVQSSPDYKSGLAGKILPGKGKSPVSLNSLPSKMKSQACDMVLKQGKSLL